MHTVRISSVVERVVTVFFFVNNYSPVTMNYFGLLPEELIQKFALLKRNCFASVFEKYFDYQQAGSGGKTQAVINYREDESM